MPMTVLLLCSFFALPLPPDSGCFFAVIGGAQGSTSLRVVELGMYATALNLQRGSFALQRQHFYINVPLNKTKPTRPLQKTAEASALEAAWSKERSWSCLRGFPTHVKDARPRGWRARGAASHPTGAAPPAAAAGPRIPMGKGRAEGHAGSRKRATSGEPMSRILQA